MEEFFREEIKTDPTMFKLLQFIKKNHEISNHTKKVLTKNKDVKDFCEESRVFVVFPPGGLGIHYDVQTWFEKDIFLIKVISIGLYDTFMEYDMARLIQLHSADQADIPGLN